MTPAEAGSSVGALVALTDDPLVVLRAVAISVGCTRDETDRLLARNPRLVANFALAMTAAAEHSSRGRRRDGP